MSEKPERIWAIPDESNVSAALAVPEVGALVEAARPFSAAVFNDNGDVTISQGNITRRHWLAIENALRDLEKAQK